MCQSKRVTAAERDAMLRMFAAMAILGTEPQNLEQRLADIPYAKRDIGLIRNTIFKLMEAVFKTVPPEQAKSLKRDVHNSTYSVKVNKTVGDDSYEKDYIMNLSYDVIYTLMEGCHDKCLMCNLDKSQRKACKLKKALDTIPNNIPDADDGDCPYFGIV